MRSLVLSMMLWLPMASIASDTPAEELRDQLSMISSLQGAFTQQVMTPEGDVIATSAGQFKLLQPGYFFWRIEEPDEQILIATGSLLWHYDVELETATRREIAAELSQSPLAVLSADAERLTELYEIERSGSSDYLLRPRFDEAGFTELVLTLDAGVPVAMSVLDKLLQRTRIEFTELVLNPHLLVDEFTFLPPEGVDVYYQGP